MAITLDIDIGGTFTEAVADKDGEIRWGKVLTTRHDLSIGVVRSIDEAAKALKTTTKDLLSETGAIRYSTTIALNNLLVRRGSRLGLITTQGLEHLVLIGRSRQWGEGLPSRLQRKTGSAVNPAPLVSEDMIVGIKERTDSLGKVLFKPSKEEILEKLHYLLRMGCRGVVVGLAWSPLNPSNETYVKSVIEEEMPNVYLGALPVFLSSETQPKWLEYPRFMVTILNAYMHSELAQQLNNLSDQVKSLGYSRQLMLVHNSGGMAKLAKTRVTDTYNAGPVAGMIGSQHIAGLYGIRNVITAEMGGTTFNIGLVVDGQLSSYEFDPVIDRWAVNLTMIENRSIGAGGGSIAWLNQTMGNRVEVGPESAGSNPGPACYDLGGREPAVTDADLVLGYLNEDYFLGGRMKLNKGKARRAIKERIADPLGLTVEDAAWAIKRVVDDHMGEEISVDMAIRGHDPRLFTIFSFGGAGPSHVVGINGTVGAPRILAFPFGTAFDAIGSSFLDIKHMYEQTVGITALDPDVPLAESFRSYSDLFNRTVAGLRDVATRDVKAEMIGGEISFELELDMRYETQMMVTRVRSPVWEIGDERQARLILDTFTSEYLKDYGVRFPEAVIRIEGLRLIVKAAPQTYPRFREYELDGDDPIHALKGKHEAFWGKGGFAETRVYDLERLRAGNVVSGDAIIEAPDTTYVLPEGSTLRLDKYKNLVIDKTVR